MKRKSIGVTQAEVREYYRDKSVFDEMADEAKPAYHRGWFGGYESACVTVMEYLFKHDCDDMAVDLVEVLKIDVPREDVVKELRAWRDRLISDDNGISDES